MAAEASAEELVMGAAVGLAADQVRPFLASLRATGYRGRIALIVDRGLERALRADPQAAGVVLIRTRQWLPFRLGLWRRRSFMRLIFTPLQLLLWGSWRALERLPLEPERRLRWQRPLAAIAYPPMESRFLRYREFLGTSTCGRVLLTDVRDVLFQSDPFAVLPEDGLGVSLESPTYTIATEPHNAAWVSRAYGQAMLNRIGPNPVSCVGVTSGDRAAILDYLEQMNGEILRLAPRRIGVGGADTAIHNTLLWTGRLGFAHQFATLRSPVATFNGVDEAQVRLTGELRVVNEDGSEPAVLHQYDRLGELGARLRRALAG